MRTLGRLAVIGTLAAAFAASGLAQEMPKPAPEMAQLAAFDGSWTCEGKMFQTPMSPAGTMKSTVEMRPELNGFFHVGTIKGTSANMPPFEGRVQMTYDTGLKQFVMLWVDNMGGWAQNMSSGWKGDTITFEGDGHMGGQTMKGRDTFTKSGANSMKHTWAMQMQGKWVEAGEETCTKK